MAFFGRVGNLLRSAANTKINSELKLRSFPYVFQAARCFSAAPSPKLFVGGISFSTDEQSLREVFSRYGEVVDVRIIVDRETGMSKGFGFVTYNTVEEASSAIQALDRQDLHGRQVGVNFANERRSGYGGGGGGYPGGGFGGNVPGGFGGTYNAGTTTGRYGVNNAAVFEASVGGNDNYGSPPGVGGYGGNNTNYSAAADTGNYGSAPGVGSYGSGNNASYGAADGGGYASYGNNTNYNAGTTTGFGTSAPGGSGYASYGNNTNYNAGTTTGFGTSTPGGGPSNGFGGSQYPGSDAGYGGTGTGRSSFAGGYDRSGGYSESGQDNFRNEDH